jgi:hypothetical protein
MPPPLRFPLPRIGPLSVLILATIIVTIGGLILAKAAVGNARMPPDEAGTPIAVAGKRFQGYRRALKYS